MLISLAIYLRLVKPIKEDNKNQFILDLVEKKMESINQSQLTQSEKFGLLQTSLVRIINEELSKIKEDQSTHSLKQTEKFAHIEQTNTESLLKIQNAVVGKLQEGVNLLSDTNKKRLDEIQVGIEKRMDEQLRKNLESFEVVQKNLVQMQGSAEKMMESTKSIDKLNNIFARTSAKSFGDFGEKYLEQFLSDNLNTSSWVRQFQPPNSSDKIDFVLYLGERKIGIDAKFPVTRYNDYLDAEQVDKTSAWKSFATAVKGMIDDICDKYYNTKYFEYVMMYVPSDGIYQAINNDSELVKHLAKKKITLTSPTTIFPLILIAHDYNTKLHVNKNAENIIQGLKKIGKNIESFQSEFRKLGEKIRLAQTNYDSANYRLENVKGEINLLGSTNSDTQTLNFEDKTNDQ